MKNFIIALAIILFAVCITGFFVNQWWFFLIPALLLGVLIPFKDWNISAFGVGFSAGFILWSTMNIYFHFVNQNQVFDKMANYSVLPIWVIWLLAAIIGGSLLGLSVHIGANLIKEKNKFDLFEEN